MRYCKEYFDDVRLVVRTTPGITTLFNKTICITGATGMLCSAVVDIIALLNKEKSAGIKLIIAGRNKEKTAARFEGLLQDGEYEFVSYDATKVGEYLPQADYYIHDSLGKNTELGCHFLLPGIFPTQGSNLGLPHCGQMPYHLSHHGSPIEYVLIMNVLVLIIECSFSASSYLLHR